MSAGAKNHGVTTLGHRNNAVSFIVQREREPSTQLYSVPLTAAKGGRDEFTDNELVK